MSIYTKDLPHIINNPNTTVDNWTYGPISVERAYSDCKLTIGKFCSLGQGIRAIFWGKHQYNDISAYPFNMLHGHDWPAVQCTEVKGEDIYIGNDCWIANDVKIHQGACIGDGVVIGAHSVVAGTIPDYSVAVGNPCRVIKQRFNDEHIAKLLEMKWWEWPIEKIKQHLQIISSSRVDDLYEIWKQEIK